MSLKATWLNDDLMTDIITTDVECQSLECSGNMSCNNFTCNNMTINSYSTNSATIGTLTTNNLLMPSITQDNALTRVLVQDPSDSSIHYNTSINSYPVTLPTTNNTLTQFTGTAGQVASTTISVTGGNSLSNLQNVVGNDPAAIMRMSNIQTSGIAEKTGGAGVFLSSKMNYTGAALTADTTVNQVIVRDPLNVNELQYRTDFLDMFTPQDALEKHFNAEFGTGSYFYSNTGSNRLLKFNVASASNNTNTTIRAAQTANRTVTLPDNSSTLVDLNLGQTLQNKNLSDTSTTIVNTVDPTKTLAFQTQDSTTGISTVVRTFSSTNRIITLPNATTTLLGDNNTTAMSNKTIDSALNTLTITNSPLSAADVNTLINQDVRTTASPTLVALTLQTTGGTPTALNYYEEGIFNLTFTGPFTAVVACNFVRVGKMVNFNMNWTGNSASAGGFFTTSGLPSRLSPAIAVDCQIWVTDNSVAQATPGRIVVSGTTISVYKGTPTTNFTAAGNCSFNNWSWTWRV